MHVQHGATQCPHEIRGQDAHEARQDDQVRVVTANLRHQCAVELLAGTVMGVIHGEGVDVGLGCPLQSEGARAVAPYRNDLAGKVPLPAGVDESLKVGAAAGSQDQDAWGGYGICLHTDNSPGA